MPARSTGLLAATLVLLLVAGCGPAGQSAAGGASASTGTVLPAAGTAIAGGTAEGAAGAPTPTRTRPNPRPDCPKLDLVLRQLLEAADPAEFARENGVQFRDGRVDVSIQLQAAEGDLVQRYDLRQAIRGSSLPNYVGAWAPLTALCDLSNDMRVQQVLKPAYTLRSDPPKP